MSSGTLTVPRLVLPDQPIHDLPQRRCLINGESSHRLGISEERVVVEITVDGTDHLNDPSGDLLQSSDWGSSPEIALRVSQKVGCNPK